MHVSGRPKLAAVDPTLVRVGHDVLQLLSSSMYLEPLTLYREYVQNAADSIQATCDTGLYALSGIEPRIDIAADVLTRNITIRDNGLGLDNESFPETLLRIGSSGKRHLKLRGFRGVGRLVGLGYCQSLVFRSRSKAAESVLELRWDCRVLRALLREATEAQVSDAIATVASLGKVSTTDYPDRFFEVELQGVSRLGNDELLSHSSIAGYLTQVAPLPFAPTFSYGSAIANHIREHVPLNSFGVYLNGQSTPLARPYKDELELSKTKFSRIRELQTFALPALDSGVAAVGWIGHHDYLGSFHRKSDIRGLRVRDGNIQVGGPELLNDAFQEERFNAWCVGELHVVDRRIMPNGRRDNFEHNGHLSNLLNQFAPIARELAKKCRTSSANRNADRRTSHNLDELQSLSALSKSLTTYPVVALQIARRAEVILERLKESSGMVDVANTVSAQFEKSEIATKTAHRLMYRASRYRDELRKTKVRAQIEVLDALFEATERSPQRDAIRANTLRRLLNLA